MSDGKNVELEARLARAGVEVTTGPAVPSAFGQDFGRIARGQPLGLIRVRDERELHTVIEPRTLIEADSRFVAEETVRAVSRWRLTRIA